MPYCIIGDYPVFGILKYCGHRMLRIRRMRNEEKERIKEKFGEMKNELENLSRQRKRDENMKMEQKMGIHGIHADP